MTAPTDVDWLALADRENAKAQCVGHIGPRLTVQSVRRALARAGIEQTIPRGSALIPGSTNTDTE